jgi:hypothetical protein
MAFDLSTMKQSMKDYINGGRNTQMEDWKQRLSRPQTLDSLYFASYLKQRQIPSRALLGLRLKLFLIGALMQISLDLMRKQVRLVERLRTQVSQLKEKDLVEKKWLPSIQKSRNLYSRKQARRSSAVDYYRLGCSCARYT